MPESFIDEPLSEESLTEALEGILLSAKLEDFTERELESMRLADKNSFRYMVYEKLSIGER